MDNKKHFEFECRCCCYPLIVILGILVLLPLFLHPSVVHFTLTDASLTQFKLSNNNNTLYYNLSLDITVRNPNNNLDIYYDYIETSAFYQGVRFSSKTLGTFFQRHKSTYVFRPVFQGQQVIPLSPDQVLEFEKQKKDGVYGIDVKILLNLRFGLGSFEIGGREPRVRCDLKVPLKTGNTTSLVNGFQASGCDWDYKWKLFD